ncbi:hypothetical protein RRG08_056372 [Elysia crispata]|uniref:Uncharacterized protein n=1 Tax=Elysia crispata TaxID=231223 RepID=A0AAE0ZRW4_9GAST|nr:hypothetical protein RRG08_056372 [Elysia crispata]
MKYTAYFIGIGHQQIFSRPASGYRPPTNLFSTCRIRVDEATNKSFLDLPQGIGHQQIFSRPASGYRPPTNLFSTCLRV